MAEWEVASELVTLLKELEIAIPKLSPGTLAHIPLTRRAPPQPPPIQYTAPNPPPSAPLPKIETNAQSPASMSVERPFDAASETGEPAYPPLPLNVPQQPVVAQPVEIFEPETPLAYPEEPQDEPSDFEWRNLKKLTVLVLSSLIWKNKTVQDQVREYGGLEALVGCCKNDEHNPYIREHAIMCLRFAVEGNSANADVIKGMASRIEPTDDDTPLAGGSVTLNPTESITSEVPREVLDTQGYETFMDGKGQVGLRRKEMASSMPTNAGSTALQAAAAQAIQGAIAGATGIHIGHDSSRGHQGQVVSKMANDRAAEIVQTALRDLPLPGGRDRDHHDIIARLNRATLEASAGVEEGSSSPNAQRRH